MVDLPVFILLIFLLSFSVLSSTSLAILFNFIMGFLYLLVFPLSSDSKIKTFSSFFDVIIFFENSMFFFRSFNTSCCSWNFFGFSTVYLVESPESLAVSHVFVMVSLSTKLFRNFESLILSWVDIIVSVFVFIFSNSFVSPTFVDSPVKSLREYSESL